MQTSAKSKENPLERYFSILEAVAAHPAASVAEIADVCALPLPTAHRLILSLKSSGLLAAGDKRRGIELGSRLLRLLQSGSEDAWIKIIVQKALDGIAEEISETSYFAKLQNDEVISIAWATPPTGLKGHVIPGLSQPLHAAACAKAILAHQNPERVRQMLSGPLPKLSINTKTSLKDVLAEHEDVRESGFATCVNENETGVVAVACPVVTPGIGTIYSIGVMSLSDRWTPERTSTAVKLLQEAAAEVSRSIIREGTPAT